jgi:tRNA dimethylallyltransferase
VGGSGLYVSSVLYDFRFPGTDAAVRGRLEAELAAEGPGALHDRLTAVDPIAAASIGPFNGRRIVRALEVVELTGAPFGAGLSAQARNWMPTTILGLRAPRAELVARLDERVRGMWRDGLLDEVRSLLPLGLEHAATAGQAIGYAQAIAQLSGKLEEAEAIELTSALTRRYARRQVGWFRREKLTHWLDYDDPERTDRAVQLVLSNG